MPDSNIRRGETPETAARCSSCARGFSATSGLCNESAKSNSSGYNADRLAGDRRPGTQLRSQPRNQAGRKERQSGPSEGACFKNWTAFDSALSLPKRRLAGLQPLPPHAPLLLKQATQAEMESQS